MKTFSIKYELKSRPLLQNGRYYSRPSTTEIRTFAAADNTEAYRLAVAEGVLRFQRRKWKIVDCLEVEKA